MPRRLRVTLQVALFVVAFVVFYLGLGIGLQQDVNLGTTLWIIAGVIVILNLLWILLPRLRRG